MARYEAGETLASIARTYDCSPPAISYVVSKSRARQLAPERPPVAPSGPEAQLVKSTASEPANSPHDHTERRAESMSTGFDSTAAPPIPQLGNGYSHRVPRDMEGSPRDDLAERSPTPSRLPASVSTQGQAQEGAGNGQPAPAGSGMRSAAAPLSRNGADMRQKLHLSLGNGTSPYNGPGDTLFPPSARSAADESRSAQGYNNQGHNGPGHAEVNAARPPAATGSRPPAAEFSEAGPNPDLMLRQSTGETGSGAFARNKEGTGAFIDQQLRARVDTDIAVFLAAFDAALTQDTQENRSALREATDRLLRAGARTRIELERLEARLPLNAHERVADSGTWRYR